MTTAHLTERTNQQMAFLGRTPQSWKEGIHLLEFAAAQGSQSHQITSQLDK